MKKLTYALAMLLAAGSAHADWFPGRYEIHSNQARAELTAYDNNGVYTVPPQDIPQFGQLARSSQIAAFMQDVATALTYVYGVQSSPNLNASLLNSGTLTCARMPGLTGAITSSVGNCATTLSAASVVLSGPIVTGILPDGNLSANIVRYTDAGPNTIVRYADTGTNFTGATPPTIGGVGIATSTSGNYVGTVVGCGTSPTVTVIWVRVGNLVTITIPTVTCTSGGGSPTTLSITGALPVSLEPVTTQWMALGVVETAGAAATLLSAAGMSAGSTTIQFAFGGSSTAWSGVKGLTSNTSFTYQIAQ